LTTASEAINTTIRKALVLLITNELPKQKIFSPAHQVH
jgi:hypothetical protein